MLNAGDKATITVTYNEAVRLVVGATPTLTLSGDRTAVLDATASDLAVGKLVFVYTVAVGDNVVSLALTGSNLATSVTDLAGNAVTAPAAAVLVDGDGDAITLDTTAPTATITRLGANPSSSATVQYSVVFTEAVTGVSMADFTLTATGVTGASITSVTGSGTTYTVSINTGSGNGSIDLDLKSNTDVVDNAGNVAVGSDGPTYTIQKLIPVDPNNFDFDNLGNSASETITGTNQSPGNLIYGGAGDDLISGGNSFSESVGQTGDNDTIYGGSGNDTITGGSGVDHIYGGSGDDVITGGPQTDWLYGGDGNDTINGSGEPDNIVGGYGQDLLTGGAGDDNFIFLDKHDTGDTITDFRVAGSGADKIDLSGIDADELADGNQAFSWYDPSTDASGVQPTTEVKANQLTWYASGTSIIIQGDTNGDAIADFQLTLTNQGAAPTIATVANDPNWFVL